MNKFLIFTLIFNLNFIFSIEASDVHPAGGSSEKKSKISEEEVKKAISDYITAMESGNIEEFKKTITDNYIQFYGGLETLKKSIQKNKQSKFEFTVLKIISSVDSTHVYFRWNKIYKNKIATHQHQWFRLISVKNSLKVDFLLEDYTPDL